MSRYKFKTIHVDLEPRLKLGPNCAAKFDALVDMYYGDHVDISSTKVRCPRCGDSWLAHDYGGPGRWYENITCSNCYADSKSLEIVRLAIVTVVDEEGR